MSRRQASHGNKIQVTDFAEYDDHYCCQAWGRIYTTYTRTMSPWISLGRDRCCKTRSHSKYNSLRSFPILPFLPLLFSISVNSSTIGLPGTYPYYKLAALFLSLMLFRQWKKGRDGNPNGLPLPPGPKGYPLIGNLFDMPVYKPWVVYDEWRKTYGKTFIVNGLSPQITGYFRWYDIPQCPWPTHCNFKFLGIHHWPVREKVFKLLRQKTYDYVEWPVRITFLSQVLVKNADRCRMDWSRSMSLMPYGLWWRKHRKLFHEYFHRNAVTKYQPIQRQEVQAFLHRLLVTPDNFIQHIRQ